MIDSHWIPDFVCPSCRGPLGARQPLLACRTCQVSYETDGRGLYRLISAERRQAAAAFLDVYRRVRRSDGHVMTSEAAWRALPAAASRDANAAEWKVRAQSFHTVLRRSRLGRGRRLRVLDVGAGNGWLSNRLVLLGHAAVAADLNDDQEDGLCAGGWRRAFVRVQAHFDALPFAERQFDVIVLNASLHYSEDPDRTLLLADRLLDAGGTLIVMDSPMFAREVDGDVMRSEQRDRHRALSGDMSETDAHAGVGFLTFKGLARTASRLKRRATFAASRGALGFRLRRSWSAYRLGRRPATFGVWVAQ